jgi:hypothetical protein
LRPGTASQVACWQSLKHTDVSTGLKRAMRHLTNQTGSSVVSAFWANIDCVFSAVDTSEREHRRPTPEASLADILRPVPVSYVIAQ